MVDGGGAMSAAAAADALSRMTAAMQHAEVGGGGGGGEGGNSTGSSSDAAEALSRMTIMEIKDWLTQHGQGQAVWEMQARKPAAKRLDWVELAEATAAAAGGAK